LKIRFFVEITMNTETDNSHGDVVVGSTARLGSVYATMPSGKRARFRSNSRAGLARAVLRFRRSGGIDINVIDPWLPKRPAPNDAVSQPDASAANEDGSRVNRG